MAQGKDKPRLPTLTTTVGPCGGPLTRPFALSPGSPGVVLRVT
jgi:hypothetical protein